MNKKTAFDNNLSNTILLTEILDLLKLQDEKIER
jgi:hypothetical protein